MNQQTGTHISQASTGLPPNGAPQISGTVPPNQANPEPPTPAHPPTNQVPTPQVASPTKPVNPQIPQQGTPPQPVMPKNEVQTGSPHVQATPSPAALSPNVPPSPQPVFKNQYFFNCL